VSYRLVEAREARGLTIRALAQMVEISAVTISAYENGRSAPSSDSLVRLASTLRFPERFFTLPHAGQTSQDGPVFWRSRSYAKQAARTRCKHRLTWLADTTSYLREFLELPAVNLPKVRLPETSFADWTFDQVEEMAAQTRTALGLGNGPIPDVVLLLENAGVVVSKFSLDGEGLDALSYWSRDGSPYVVLSDDCSFARQQYNAAHEFAHLLLHRAIADADVNRTDLHKLIEAQAFRFASAFLLPGRAFASELWAPTLRAFESLKARWLVSIGVMLTRCRELGIIDDDQARWLWIKYSRLGYKQKEPLDDAMPTSNPRLLRRSIEMLVEEGIQTRDSIRNRLALPAGEIEALCSLRSGYLRDETQAGAVLSMPKIRQDAPRDQPTAPNGGSVLPFGKRPQY
jgi:Zn-dependent peptidase ImmA (M78 family)/transcriptional regulator with XRE-family HTH domain